MVTIKQHEWELVGEALFGEDKINWRFQCPVCGNVQSIAIAKEKWPELEGRGWQPHTECIGRYLEERGGCDWAAYGLFQGPVLIEVDGADRPIASFDFERAAYEAKGMPSICDASA